MTNPFSFIEKIMNENTPAAERIGGSLATAMWGLQCNVQMFRVHDVAQTVQAIKIYQSIASASL